MLVNHMYMMCIDGKFTHFDATDARMVGMTLNNITLDSTMFDTSVRCKHINEPIVNVSASPLVTSVFRYCNKSFIYL